MKTNGDKRKIFDAVDLLTEEASAQTVNNDIHFVDLSEVKPFHDTPFRRYSGERFSDMVESIKEHGILNPIIIRKMDCYYEILSGHNRVEAAKAVGLKEVPAIIKENISEEEAYVYVIETNLLQRSFMELLPSEKASVMAAHYDKVCCQGKRNDIIRELQILNGEVTDRTCCHNGNKYKSIDLIAEEYGFSSRNAARYLRINYLIPKFKEMIDENKLGLVAAVDISYLSNDEQELLWKIISRQGLMIKPNYAIKLHKEAGSLTEERILEIIEGFFIKHSDNNSGVSLKIPKSLCEKYFEGMTSKEMSSVIEKAIEAWFVNKIDNGR